MYCDLITSPANNWKSSLLMFCDNFPSRRFFSLPRSALTSCSTKQSPMTTEAWKPNEEKRLGICHFCTKYLFKTLYNKGAKCFVYYLLNWGINFQMLVAFKFWVVPIHFSDKGTPMQKRMFILGSPDIKTVKKR